MESNKILKISILSGLFLVPFIPFIVTSSMLYPFITGKAFAFRIIVEILFVLWIILAFKDENYRPKFSWILGSLVIFIAIVGIADLLGKDPLKSFWSNYERMEGWVTLIHLLMYFVIASSTLITEKLWNRFWGTWIVSSLLMAFYGFLQLAGKADIHQGGVRVDGALGNATYLAVFMMFAFFITLYMYAKKKINLLTLIPIGLIQLFIIYHTATRGAVLGLIGGIFLIAVILTLGGSSRSKTRKFSLIVITTTVLLVAGFISIRNTQFVKQSPVLQRFATLSVDEIRTQGRYYVWPMAVKGFAETPILGWGQENFNYVFNKNYDPRMYNQEQWFDRAHSVPLDWLIASGILGLAGYLSLYVFLLYSIWKKSEDLSFVSKSILTGLVVAYFFQNLFVFDNLISYILFVSLLAAFHQKNGNTSDKFEMFFNNNIARRIVPAVLVVALMFTLYFANYKPIRAGQTLIDTLTELRQNGASMDVITGFEKTLSYSKLGRAETREQLVSAGTAFLTPQVPIDLRQKYFEFATGELEKQLEDTPDNARYQLFAGELYNQAGLYSEAIIKYEKALELSPNKQTIMFELGGAYVNSGNTEEALNIFKRAYELDSSFTNAEILYGISAIYDGEYSLAEDILSMIPAETLANDDRVINAYANKGLYDPLIRIFRKKVEENPEDIQTNMSLAVAYLKAGQRQKSIEILQNVAEMHPEYNDQIQIYINDIIEGRDPSQ